MLDSRADYCTRYFAVISNGGSDVGYKPYSISHISNGENEHFALVSLSPFGLIILLSSVIGDTLYGTCYCLSW